MFIAPFKRLGQDVSAQARLGRAELARQQSLLRLPASPLAPRMPEFRAHAQPQPHSALSRRED